MDILNRLKRKGRGTVKSQYKHIFLLSVTFSSLFCLESLSLGIRSNLFLFGYASLHIYQVFNKYFLPNECQNKLVNKSD